MFRKILNLFQILLIKSDLMISNLITKIYFRILGVEIKSFKSYGIPYIHISLSANFKVGEHFVMGNSIKNNATGITGRCKIDVRKSATLEIGNNVGITLTTINCFNRIVIDDNVKIGFGTHIMDTDFHSLNPLVRAGSDDDVKTAPIHIKKNVFIGAHCLIMKGVTIGENAIIGAGSIVTKSIPDNEIWGGNPAKFIKKIDIT